jgi:hypothetical protein
MSVMLFQNKEYAEKLNPLFRLVTNDIEGSIKSFIKILHPNLREITLISWGAKEFALLDQQFGIVIQQW